MSKNKGKGKEREKPATEDQDAPSGQSTATAASATPAKRRKNAPSKLPAVSDSPSTSDDEPGITVKLRPNRKGLRIDAVRLSTTLLFSIHHFADLSSTCV